MIRNDEMKKTMWLKKQLFCILLVISLGLLYPEITVMAVGEGSFRDSDYEMNIVISGSVDTRVPANSQINLMKNTTLRISRKDAQPVSVDEQNNYELKVQDVSCTLWDWNWDGSQVINSGVEGIEYTVSFGVWNHQSGTFVEDSLSPGALLTTQRMYSVTNQVHVYDAIDGQDVQYISSGVVRRYEDGTAPFDAGDALGCDSGDNNRIVRNLDTIRYTLAVSTESYLTNTFYKDGYIGVVVKIPYSEGEVQFETSAMDWMVSGDLNENYNYKVETKTVGGKTGQVLTAYAHLNADLQGLQAVFPVADLELPLVLRVNCVNSSDIIDPTVYTWVDANDVDLNAPSVTYECIKDSKHKDAPNAGRECVEIDVEPVTVSAMIVDVRVEKRWCDTDSDSRTESVNIRLMKSVNGADPTAVIGKTLELKADVDDAKNWKGSFEGLPGKEGVDYITYSVEEISVPRGYVMTSVNRKDEAGNAIENDFIVANITETAVNGSITWEDDGDTDRRRPASVTVNLMKQVGNAAAQQIDSKNIGPDAGGTWPGYSWSSLPMYDENGTMITYSVTADAITGYTYRTEGYNIISTPVPKSQEPEPEPTPEPIPEPEPQIKISDISISGISNKITAGKKVQLTANVSPANASNKAVIWNSGDPNVATVDANGLVTVKAKAGGKSVVITATAQDGSGKSASFRITGMKGAVKSIKLSGKKTVKAGTAIKVKVTIKTTKGKVNKKLKWTSGNPSLATVSSSGKVKTFKGKKGKVKITVMSTDGTNKKKSVTIKIK